MKVAQGHSNKGSNRGVGDLEPSHGSGRPNPGQGWTGSLGLLWWAAEVVALLLLANSGTAGGGPVVFRKTIPVFLPVIPDPDPDPCALTRWSIHYSLTFNLPLQVEFEGRPDSSPRAGTPSSWPCSPLAPKCPLRRGSSQVHF